MTPDPPSPPLIHATDCADALAAGLPIVPADACPKPKTSTADTPVPLAKILPPVLIVSFAAVILGWWVWRRLRGRNKDLSKQLLTTTNEMEATQTELVVICEVWEIDWDEVTRDNCIGQGAMGQVWQGHWRGMNVAVKVLTGVYQSDEDLRKEMDHEATMLQTLRHAHVVQFLGAGTTADGRPFIVTELMELGALTGLLMPTGGGEGGAWVVG